MPETVGKPMLETIEEIEQEKLIEGRESENQILSRGTLASKDEVINEEEKENKKDNV